MIAREIQAHRPKPWNAMMGQNTGHKHLMSRAAATLRWGKIFWASAKHKHKMDVKTDTIHCGVLLWEWNNASVSWTQHMGVICAVTDSTVSMLPGIAKLASDPEDRAFQDILSRIRTYYCLIFLGENNRDFVAESARWCDPEQQYSKEFVQKHRLGAISYYLFLMTLKH